MRELSGVAEVDRVRGTLDQHDRDVVGGARATSRTRLGLGMSGSFDPMTASEGTGTCSRRSSDGNRVSWLNRFKVLIGPNFR